MKERSYTGLFVCEGTSDLPLADLVETLFLERGVPVRLSKPDFTLLTGVPKDIRSRVAAGMTLLGTTDIDLVVVHRDADNAGPDVRRSEIEAAVAPIVGSSSIVPVIPVRMTEAWLLLDEQAIRRVAGNPRGRVDLALPKVQQAEREADPKQRLKECLLAAADVTGRRHEQAKRRFPQHRRQLLELLDCAGPVTGLASWNRLVADITLVATAWAAN